MPDNRQYKRDKRSPTPKSATVSKLMSRIKAQNTKPETLFRKALYNEGLRGYRANYAKLPGKPDIAFIKKKVWIFVHGCFWHGCPICGGRVPKHNNEYWSTKLAKNIARDQKRKNELEEMGYQVIEIWEHEVKKELTTAVSKVLTILNAKLS